MAETICNHHVDTIFCRDPNNRSLHSPSGNGIGDGHTAGTTSFPSHSLGSGGGGWELSFGYSHPSLYTRRGGDHRVPGSGIASIDPYFCHYNTEYYNDHGGHWSCGSILHPKGEEEMG